MCGITGFLNHASFEEATGRRHLRAMAGGIAHRGPDDAGYWIDASAGAALGHRRLAIVDLSAQGHQPMVSACGRYVIAFNGEIYNFERLRRELARSANPPAWRGHSDTEVLLAALATWGTAATLRRLCGMFAFALWDRQARELTLARDPLGEKPLYYGWIGRTFVFGSELHALCRYPGAENLPVDRDALGLYMRYNSIPAPHSIYRGVSKLMPGTFLRVTAGRGEARVEPYWSLADTIAEGRAAPFTGTEEEAASALDVLLRGVLAEQMNVDVPLGAFLSGGIDSTTVVALMQAEAARPVRTFTIGFHDAGFDEAQHARAVARHLGTQHTELYVTPSLALDIVPQLPFIYDEPFADASQIPTFLVSRMTRGHVTVSLSGDGGDELFGGYNRHVIAAGAWSRLDRVPVPARRFAARCIQAVRGEHFDRVAHALNHVLPARRRQNQVGAKLHKLARVMSARDLDALYRQLVSTFDTPGDIVLNASAAAPAMPGMPAGLSSAERMMVLDTLNYLPTDILAKVDRAAMSVSLETRVPMLDRRVVEFAWRLPVAMKVRDGEGKRVLRRLLGRYVPRELIDRPKQGFGVPVAAWLRGELRDWASAMLDPRRIREDGLLAPEPVARMWAQHCAGTHDWHGQLWSIVMFQAWRDASGRSAGRTPEDARTAFARQAA